MSRQKEHTVVKNGGGHMGADPLFPIPFDQRQRWITPALTFSGLESCVPVLMTGAALAASFSPKNVFFIFLAAFVGIQWLGNTVNGYMGAKTGRASSALANGSFGSLQARAVIAVTIFLASIGWLAVQTAVAGNAVCAAFGIDYRDPASFGMWSVITIIAGVIFAAPSVIGHTAIRRSCYVTLPAGLALAAFGIYLAGENAGGFVPALSHAPGPGAASLTLIGAVNIILGVNLSQWVIAADYTRYAKPGLRDNMIIPLGVMAAGLPLVLAGALMAAGQGSADIVEVMAKLGFPYWGFIILLLAVWTSQLVSTHSMGLALGSLLNVRSARGRACLTALGTAASLAAAISGILDHFIDFLFLMSLLYAPIAGIIATDFFLRRGNWKNNFGWNWMATLALAFGAALGYYTAFVQPAGIPAIQCAVGSGAVYALATRAKAAVKPDVFTPPSFLGAGCGQAETPGAK